MSGFLKSALFQSANFTVSLLSSYCSDVKLPFITDDCMISGDLRLLSVIPILLQYILKVEL